jgi:serine/threonine protein kinase
MKTLTNTQPFIYKSDRIDFGLSKHFKNTEMGTMKEAVGTPYYVAPEVLAGNCEQYTC